MKIFYLEWNSFCNEDMFDALTEMGHDIVKIPFSGIQVTEEEAEKLLEDELKRNDCDFLFSFNYFPNVSRCCNRLGIKYVSWVYDCPYLHVYSYTVLNSCNYIFLFDYALYSELKNGGIHTVYYLPLAVNDKRLSAIKCGAQELKKYSCDISFVGSLYTEQKHRIYEKFKSISPYARGYLNGIIQAQLHVQGYNFLQELLGEDILEEMQKAYPTDPNSESAMTPEAIYADYVLSRQVTAIERKQILQLLGLSHQVYLYTYDQNVRIPGVDNKGKIDYYHDMPYVFMNTKINLNITLRSIKTGIPLRALDIMGSGGFLLTNYQEEMFEYFEADKDFVYYTDHNDLKDKVTYYLEHDQERQEIARSGCEKVRKYHNLRSRMEEMLEVLVQ